MTISDPTLFAFKPDWGEPFKVVREWSTDIQSTDDGSEIRVQRRSSAAIRCDVRVLFNTEYGAGRLLAHWRGASQPLRYYVPLWCDATDLDTTLAGGESSIACDTTDRPFFEASGYAMLYSENWNGVVTSELVTIDMLTSTTGFSITGTVANAYASGSSTRVVPCRIMWLALPQDVTWLSARSFQADLSFTEERAQAGYQLADASATPAAASIEVHYGAENKSDLTGGIKFIEASVFDADGVPLPLAEVTWTLNAGDASVVPSLDSRFCLVTTGSVAGTITASSGSASVTFSPS